LTEGGPIKGLGKTGTKKGSRRVELLGFLATLSNSLLSWGRAPLNFWANPGVRFTLKVRGGYQIPLGKLVKVPPANGGRGFPQGPVQRGYSLTGNPRFGGGENFFPSGAMVSPLLFPGRFLGHPNLGERVYCGPF